MTPKIEKFLQDERPATPFLVVDLDVVKQNYRDVAAAFPGTAIFYAVKANPAPEVLQSLNALGASFDASSLAEIDMAIAAGATPDRISFGNTVKRESEIALAFALGVHHFAFDSEGELEKIARAAPGAMVFCRLAVDSAGAQWPLHRKFGCSGEVAHGLLVRARDLGLKPTGLSFHVGSQQMSPERWDDAISRAAMLCSEVEEERIALDTLNLGGGLPVAYREETPTVEAVGEVIRTALQRHFGAQSPATMLEPGRAIAGSAGIIVTEVLLVAERDHGQRWVYLDIGIYGGLAEAVDEAIQYPIDSTRTGTPEPAILAGPTCDSNDVMYERAPYLLPNDLATGDRLLIGAAGAYTTTYSSVGFNGFSPLTAYYI